jgi:hypothetical protein
MGTGHMVASDCQPLQTQTQQPVFGHQQRASNKVQRTSAFDGATGTVDADSSRTYLPKTSYDESIAHGIKSNGDPNGGLSILMPALALASRGFSWWLKERECASVNVWSCPS